MITEEFWRSWLGICLVAGPFLLGLTSVVYSLYLSRRHLDSIKAALKNSRYVYLWGPSLGTRGLVWSLLEIAKITGMVMMPRAYIRLGDLDPVDLKDFPQDLKLLLKIDFVMLTSGVVWLAIISVLQEL
ncbi:hypothetical protein AYK59_15475 [Pseudomonas synxantha]|nr:hypothetical protein AYK59_15475 [Pseudomonas synxantha]KRP46529.1 hypothetical protein TU77_27680 [Pseudomonas synxantha]